MRRCKMSETAAGAQLQQLLDDEWEFRLREDPLFATRTGDHRFDNLLPAVTEADYQRRLAQMQTFRDRLAHIDRTALTAADRLNYDVFARVLDEDIGEKTHRAYTMPIGNLGGFHVDFLELPD